MNPTCNKIKIVHVITRFDKGGSAENTFLTVRDLDKYHYDIVLVTGASQANSPVRSGDSESAAIGANIASLRAKGVRMISIPHLVREPNPLADVAAFFSLVRIFRREKPRIVHTHTSKAGIIGRWAAFICRVPIIIHTPHGHVFWGYFNPWRTRFFILLERWTARITTAIVTLTPQEKEDHLHFRIAPEERFSTIHSGVDLDRYMAPAANISEMRTILDLPDGSFVVGTVGRLTPIKGHIHLLRAAVDIVAERPDIFFVFVGEGELRDDLQRYATEAGIAENVRFPGWRSDVERLLSVFDIFVFPSLNEGMGKAIVEALAMGRPVVASNVGGIPDLVISGENGILVRPADDHALFEAIKTLCENPDKRRRLGERGRETAAGYNVEAMIHKIDRLYCGLISPVSEGYGKNGAGGNSARKDDNYY
jgi:glycosyltransferase involved in cell wall biosynthesis